MTDMTDPTHTTGADVDAGVDNDHPTPVATAYGAVCPQCGTAVHADDANELIAFYRRHHRVTGHEVRIDHADPSETDAPTALADPTASATSATPRSNTSSAPPVVDVVRERQADCAPGVPVGIVAVVLSVYGVGIGETLSRLHERRLTGALYEPIDDHLRAL